MNRRGFFGACAALAVAPVIPLVSPPCKVIQMKPGMILSLDVGKNRTFGKVKFWHPMKTEVAYGSPAPAWEGRRLSAYTFVASSHTL